MTKLNKSLLLFLLLLIAIAIPLTAKAATLAWDPSPSTEVIGYKVYYRVNTASFPFNGTSLSEGVSPITATNNYLTIDLPNDGNIYYFAVKAVSSTGLESSFSNIVASEWIPYLITPTNNAAANTVVNFAWEPHPSDDYYSFDLYYGTDPNFDTSATAFTAPGTFNTNWPSFTLNTSVTLAVLLSLLLAMVNTGRAKRLWHPVRVGFCIGVLVLQASCGGSGGGGGSDEIGSSPSTLVSETVTPAPLFTNIVSDINATEYKVTDLRPNTQYYWKIVAEDNWGQTYESIPQKFTTLSN